MIGKRDTVRMNNGSDTNVPDPDDIAMDGNTDVAGKQVAGGINNNRKIEGEISAAELPDTVPHMQPEGQEKTDEQQVQHSGGNMMKTETQQPSQKQSAPSNIDTSNFTSADVEDPKLAPLRSLIQCADKKDIQINIPISLKGIDGKLYEVLTQNFKTIEGVEDKVCEILLQSLDQNELKQQIIKAISDSYKKGNLP